MQTSQLLIDPKMFATERMIERGMKEIQIATEIYLAQKCTRIHYADLMDDVPDGTASKNSLTSWLNDNVRKGELIRRGLISLYKKEMPSHFNNGVWNALYFSQFVKYTLEKLTDIDFVKNNKIIQLYKNSVHAPLCIDKASSVMGLKLLEELHSLNKLNSVVAKTLLDLNKNNRELLSKNGAIIGRVAKNNQLDSGLTREVKGLFEEFHKKQWQLEIKKHSQHEEYKLLEEYKPDIETALIGVTINLIEGE